MLNNKYKISVIVPVYNLKNYLPRCLDSILNQTYSNLEVIVVSDGSTDGSDDVIKEYAEKDKRIVAIFKENSGVSDTRNRGLETATGDYIGFVDGDDYIEPEMYEVLLKNALENDADISHCGFQMVFPSRVDYYYNTGRKVIQDNKKGIIDIIKGDYIEPCSCNKLYKRAVLENVRMPENIKTNEDVIFNVDAFINSKKSFYEDKAYYHYILRKGSAATSKLNHNKVFDPVKVCEMIVDRCSGFDNEIRNVATQRYTGCIISSYRNVKVNQLKEYYNEIELCRQELKTIECKSLSKRMKTEKFLILYFPWLYVTLFKFYDRFISKNKDKYEVK